MLSFGGDKLRGKVIGDGGTRIEETDIFQDFTKTAGANSKGDITAIQLLPRGQLPPLATGIYQPISKEGMPSMTRIFFTSEVSQIEK